MKQSRYRLLWVLFATAVLVVALITTGLAFWRTPEVLAQASTNTPRPGIQTLLTPPAAAATGLAPQAPQVPATAVPPTPLASPPITSTSSLTGTVAFGPGAGTITVVGEGQVKVQPDIARVNVGVDTVNASVKDASNEARQTMQGVIRAVKAVGVADKDIQTSNFNIYVERIPPSAGGPTTEQVRYHVTNGVNLVVRNLDQVGDVLDAAIAAGANNVQGVTFSVEDPTKAESLARQKAVADAQRRAAELAQLNGVRVGPVVSVSEVIGNQAIPTANSLREAAVPQGAGGASNLQPGELELTMLLQVTYAMQ